MPADTLSLPTMLVSQAEAAKALAMTTAWLRRLTRDGAIRAVMIGKRGIRYDVRDLAEFIEKRKTAGSKPTA